MPFVLRDCAGNFTSEIKTRRKNKTNIQYNIKTRKMSKLQKIIKDIVKQQLEFAEKTLKPKETRNPVDPNV